MKEKHLPIVNRVEDDLGSRSGIETSISSDYNIFYAPLSTFSSIIENDTRGIKGSRRDAALNGEEADLEFLTRK